MAKRYVLLSLLLFSQLCFTQTSDAEYNHLDSLFEKGSNNIYSQKDSAYYYFNTALKLAEDYQDGPYQAELLDFLIYTNGYHYDLEDYLNNLNKMNLLLHGSNYKPGTAEYIQLNKRYNINAGNYYFKIKDYNRAKAYFQILYNGLSAKEQITTPEDAETFRGVLAFLATIYKNQGKHHLAEDYYKKGIALIENHLDLFQNPKLTVINIKRLLAQMYSATKDYKKANGFLGEALGVYRGYYKNNPNLKNSIVSSYQHLTENHIAQDSLLKAKESLEMLQSYLIEDDPFYKIALLLCGDLYTKSKDYKKAQEHYTKALKVFKDYRQNQPHEDVAMVYKKIVELNMAQNNYEKALQIIQTAYSNAGQNINITSNTNNPKPDQVFSLTQLLHLADLKLQALQIGYAETGEDIYLTNAINTSKTILETFNLLKKRFESKLDKRFLTENAYSIFHRMMAVTYEAYLNKPSDEILELAVNISEKNKDLLLLDALRSTSAVKFGNIPDRVIDEETRLKAKINRLEKQLFKNDDKNKNANLNDSLFQLKNRYYTFLDNLKSIYPKYHNLKYGKVMLTLKDITTLAKKEEATLLSFTLTDDVLYSLSFSKDGSRFQKTSFSEEDHDKISRFHQAISKPSLSNLEELKKDGKILYDKLLKEPLAKNNSKHLVIIPDGILHYLPFELLQDDNDDYLLFSKTISYDSSITSLKELLEKPASKQNRLLAIAPSFESDNSKFERLLYNASEVEDISKAYESTVLNGPNATLTNFMEQSSNYSMIHLATHASANDEFPDYSFLAFEDEIENKESDTENTLYIKDLYNMSLNTNLVTLSACETGIGKLRKGEGMLSLSKGFFYAGSKSLLTTLWKVNDKSSAKLMSSFYKNLAEGDSKDEALQQAKIDYLKSTDDELLRHPYYWAGFVLSGDISATSTNYFWWYFGIVAMALLLFILFLRRRRNP